VVVVLFKCSFYSGVFFLKEAITHPESIRQHLGHRLGQHNPEDRYRWPCHWLGWCHSL